MLARFIRDEAGLEAVEYAVMTALIVSALIAAVALLADALVDHYDLVGDAVDALPDPD
jgi:Flp pilus assembly pilin Flp